MGLKRRLNLVHLKSRIRILFQAEHPDRIMLANYVKWFIEKKNHSILKSKSSKITIVRPLGSAGPVTRRGNHQNGFKAICFT